MTLIERGEALRDKFRSCGRSLVTGLEPVDCREAAAVIEELLRELEVCVSVESSAHPANINWTQDPPPAAARLLAAWCDEYETVAVSRYYALCVFEGRYTIHAVHPELHPTLVVYRAKAVRVSDEMRQVVAKALGLRT